MWTVKAPLWCGIVYFGDTSMPSSLGPGVGVISSACQTKCTWCAVQLFGCFQVGWLWLTGNKLCFLNWQIMGITSMEKFSHWIHHETYNISAKQIIRVVTAWWGRCGSCWVIITHYVKLFGGFATFHVVWSRPHPVDISVLQAARMGVWDTGTASSCLALCC